MPQIAIIVEYEINEGREGDFESLIKEHARRTLFEEGGCLRFEVLQPVDDHGTPIAGRMMVSELYADQTAVDMHRANPRMSALRTNTGALLKSRRVTITQVLDDSGDDEGLAPEDLNASNDG